jgi:hypothetical protein
MVGLTYETYKNQVAEMAVVSPNDTNFLSILQMMIDYATLRINRDLDLLDTSASLTGPSYKLTAGDRRLSFSQNLSDGSYFVVSEQINLISPAGDTDPDVSERIPLLPATKEYLDAVFGSSLSGNLAQPKYFVPFNDTLFLVGPVPDVDYYVEVVGTLRPAPLGFTPQIVSAIQTLTTGNISFATPHGLSSGTLVTLTGFAPFLWNGTFLATVTGDTTISVALSASVDVPTSATMIGSAGNGNGVSFISQYLPDLLIMASMVYISAYQRNFGRQSDDPQMAQSYEGQYQALLKSATVEEARKKFEAAAWSSQSPAQVASPTRG